MDLGVIIASIALLISATLAAPKLWDLWSFRRPIAKVEAAEFNVKSHSFPPKTYSFLGPGLVVINVRGANRLISFHRIEIAYVRPGDRRITGGFGTGSPTYPAGAAAAAVMHAPYIAELPKHRWTRLQLPVQVGLPVAEDGELPASHELKLLLESPEMRLVVRIPLRLSGSKDKYLLDDHGREARRALSIYGNRKPWYVRLVPRRVRAAWAMVRGAASR